MSRFDLQEIIFKTPTQNVPANRIKEKLGLPLCGQVSVDYDFMLPNISANLYRLPRQDLDRLLI
jgi:hypothetical protein